MVSLVIILCLIIGVLIFFISINLINIKRMKRLKDYCEPVHFPAVTVIIPARNEEHNIARCLYSLLQQDYPHLEIVAVDDNSTDNTLTILEQIRSDFPQLKLVRGKSLPAGWSGKNWACHQGAEAAGGELLLFTDADTHHHTLTVRYAVAALQEKQADFLTALPAQSTLTFPEKSIIPLLFWAACSVFPFPFLDRIPYQGMAFGNGQFMLYRRKTYDTVGGYAAIRSNLVDDMAMARLVKKCGLKTVIADGSAFISCRMYTNAGDIFKGLTKNIFLIFQYSLPRFLAVPAYLVCLFLFWLLLWAPVAFFILGILFLLAGIVMAKSVIVLSLAAILLSLCTFSLVYTRFRYPVYMIWLYPLNGFLFLLIAIGSLIGTMLKLTHWKGRRLHIGNS